MRHLEIILHKSILTFSLVLFFILSLPFLSSANPTSLSREDTIITDTYIEEDSGDTADMYATMDPLEGFNQVMFEFNMFLDKIFLRPTAYLYSNILPFYIQDRVHDFLSNLSAPLTIINDFLQFNMDKLGNSTARFVLNTIFGIFGLFDVAKEMGLEEHKEDFDKTLALWGMDSGPYLMLPILGATTFRGGLGLIASHLSDPFNIWALNHNKKELMLYRWGAEAVDKRSKNYKMFDSIEATSLDYYATIRSLYFQDQLSKISNDDLAYLDTMETPLPGDTVH